MTNNPLRFISCIAALYSLSALASPLHAQATNPNDYSVVWESPGKDFKDSMPIGNGDLGMNLWTEQNGDILFLIGKTDAWTENGQLVKLGRVRVKLDPSPFKPGALFRQILQPRKGEIELHGSDGAVLHAWIDANAPVIHLEYSGDQPVSLRASVELWRTQPRVTKVGSAELEGQGSLREINGLPAGEVVIEPDTVAPAKNNRLTWYHRNTRSVYPLVLENQHLESLLSNHPDPLLNRTFGIVMQGPGLVSANDKTLESAHPQKNIRLDLFALTTQSPSIGEWSAAMEKLVARVGAQDLEKARHDHQQWWDAFWNRSWVNVSGDQSADQVTQSYAMQRWMTAGGGRGAMAMKYNGSIFTVGQEPAPGTVYDPAKGQRDPDFRGWGGNYWFQNQRLLYWPMIADGDIDTLMPFFTMYTDALPLAKERIKLYWKHDGAVFPETIYFWGTPSNNDFGWGNHDVVIRNTWIRNHINGSLELTTMLLDTYAQTEDPVFARNVLLPLASAITTYFDQHWPRVAGKIHLDPDQALETFQSGVVNPTPDIAGLMSVLPRLLALPSTLATSEQRSLWSKMLADLPPLPKGPLPEGRTVGRNEAPYGKGVPAGTQVILPAEKYGKPGNVENPELYAIFPYHLFGVDMPDLELARNSYNARLFKSSTCWGQDGIEAAMLGLTDLAKSEVTANFTRYGGERFKWFWARGHDWEPDFDNGGAGQVTLQRMLLQNIGDKILLFPAWPKSWDVAFKLYAPKQTTLEGVWKGGKLEKLKVTPASRAKDVVQLAPQ